MTKPANHFKIGLFVLFILCAFVASAAGFGAKSVTSKTVDYHTYFNESVQGLEIGAPVKFRGVTIGAVSAIEIAPDHRHVDVVAELDVKSIRKMGLTEAGTKAEPVHFSVPPNMRAQLGSQGITGVKFLLIDYFDVNQNPVPELPFSPAENYIPAAVSLFKSLEDSVVAALDKLPEMSERVVSVLSHVDGMLEDLERRGVPAQIATTLENAVGALQDLRGFIKKTDQAKIPEKAAKTIEDLDRAIGKMNGVLERLDGKDGLVASVKKASDSVGAFGKSATTSTRNVDETLRALAEAAEAIRDLADALDRDPDMMLKGRSRKHTK